MEQQARALMVVGTASNVGKSVLCTALCRIFHQDGVSVAPFKAQNMSLNSAVTPSGREIGRAQAAQAEACGILPNEHMNPVLLKPTGDLRSQVVLQGRVLGDKSAYDYFWSKKEDIWQAVVESYQYLARGHQVIVMEGAGSPVEMNLKSRDIVNMRAAEMADAKVILVADIDRGGVFASVVGTMQLLTASERARVIGVIVNKFRGEPRLFEEGVRLLEAHAGVPVLGVIPHIGDLGIDEEDSVSLQSDRYTTGSGKVHKGNVRIGIIALPHISNFTDFDPLFLEAGVSASFCSDPDELRGMHAVILPGTKNTIDDLLWLREHGFMEAVQTLCARGGHVFGICGGYQMLGQAIFDPEGLESGVPQCEGIALFANTTTMSAVKRTVLAEGRLCGDFDGILVQGYEIHMGITQYPAKRLPFAGLETDDGSSQWEGDRSSDGRVIGTYLHGILHNDAFRASWLDRLRADVGLPRHASSIAMTAWRNEAYDRLANVVRDRLDVGLIYEALSIGR